MPPPAHQEPVTFDPTSVAFVDGLSCTACDDNVIVYGGSAADRVWRLHLPSATWTEIPCVGTVPPPRYFHAAAHCNGYLAMCGGELMVSDHYCHPARVNYYELNLDTYEWSCLDTFDDVPLNRSHHTMTALKGGKEMVVLGGKPIPAGTPQGNLTNRVLTSRQFHELRGEGFYDLFVLYPMSRTWKRIEMFDPQSPVIWGHSASMYSNTHILFFGGCDVAQADWRSIGAPSGGSSNGAAASGAYYTSDEPPVASLSNTVHILTIDTWQWQQYEIPPKDAGPVPRALHVAESCCDELIVFGGFTINRFGAVVTTTDCWMWSVRRGSWQRMEFCVPQWSSKKLLSCVYGTQWIVMSSLDTVFFMEMTKVQLGWQRASTKVQRLLAAPTDRAGMVRRSLPTPVNNGAGGLFPPHLYVASPSKSLDPEESPFNYKPTPQQQQSRAIAAEGGHEHDDDVYHYIAALREEVDHLRQELNFTASVAETTHTVEFTRPRTDAERNSKLMRWDMYSPQSAADKDIERHDSLRVDTKTGSPLLLGSKWNRQRAAPDAAAVAGVSGSLSLQPPLSSKAAQHSAAPPPAVGSAKASSQKPRSSGNRSPPQEAAPGFRSHTSNDDEDGASSTASTPSEAAVALQPRFVDRKVMDKAAKKKLEVFRKLQAKAERNVRETEHALKMFGKLEQQEATAAATSGVRGTISPVGVRTSPRPVRDTPASSDSEENEDIHRAAELGLQLHRAMMNNTESRRQLLFRERKRRIEQLQDRLRTLESAAGEHPHHHPHHHQHHHHHGRSVSGGGAGGGGGSSPDVKTFVGVAMRHSEAIQRMMEAHDLGELYEDEGEFATTRNKQHSASSSLVVRVPNTNAPQSLRSSSFSSLTTDPSMDDAAVPFHQQQQQPMQGDTGEFDAQPVEHHHSYEVHANHHHQKHQQHYNLHAPGIVVSSATSGLMRRDSMVSDVSRMSRQDSLASNQRQLQHNSNNNAPLVTTTTTTASSVAVVVSTSTSDKEISNVALPPAAVFRGFQRQRSKTSVHGNSSTQAHLSASPQRANVSQQAQRRPSIEVDDSAVPPQDAGGAAAEEPQQQQHLSVHPVAPTSSLPPMPVVELAAPTNTTLQNQWDVLQAALLSRGGAGSGPRRVYTASNNI
ncbi:Hypothetical protein, putative [Bodo saltans]|uniref:Galactose oxidase n=1 Tax=Bodo saltans TaxID=75058 RepID=A0A0S4JVL3_BODSA|nr:Hypothetical protein, putative [Bodo saltans]|eukprot:CUG94438.1 Hypothetical protein, putative [Bodo saltans]